jgi:hypothetical protein
MIARWYAGGQDLDYWLRLHFWPCDRFDAGGIAIDTKDSLTVAAVVVKSWAFAVFVEKIFEMMGYRLLQSGPDLRKRRRWRRIYRPSSRLPTTPPPCYSFYYGTYFHPDKLTGFPTHSRHADPSGPFNNVKLWTCGDGDARGL